MNRSRGFTLVELVLTIIILGVVAVYAIPRMRATIFDARVAAQELVEAIRFAQAMSMNNSGANYYRIQITNAGYTVTQNGNPIVNPLTNAAPYSDDNWAGKGITTNANTTVFFNSRGQPFDLATGNPLAAALAITVTASGENEIVQLEQLTGYARII